MDESPKVSAPDHDMANVSPKVPPASRDVGSIARTVMGTISVGIGIAVTGIFLFAALFGTATNPDNPPGAASGDDVIGSWIGVVAGIFWILSGVGIYRRGVLLAAVSFVIALALSILATMVY